MNANTVYLGYDQTALDAQYNNRIAVPEHTEIYAAWKIDCERVLMNHDHRLDVAYGPEPTQKLDIILPDTDGPFPINIFIHGGFWMSRSKDDMTFVAEGLADAGAAVVIIDYALMPDVTMDDIVRQCREAVVWVYKNADSFGGDPERIHISGNSAGGHLVAMLMSTTFSDVPANIIKSGCALSGIYDLEPIRHTYMQATLNLSEEDVQKNSPLKLAPSSRSPLIIFYGTLESDEFKRHAGTLLRTWGSQCTAIERPGKNHFTIVADFADAKGELAKAVFRNMGLSDV